MAALTGVGATALRAAGVRARESERADRLFADPLAATFVRSAGGVPESRGDPATRAALGLHVVVRTRFYDDYLLDAVAAGCRQVVLVAAGLDSRAFRLPWPTGVRLFEVDLPEVLAFKQAALETADVKATCARTVVAGDLTGDWTAALVAAGLSPGRPTAWLAEGVLVYLGPPAAAGVVGAVTRLSAAGSRFAFEAGEAATALRRDGSVDGVTSLWQGGLSPDDLARMNGAGWELTRHAFADVAAAYGRPTPRPSRSGFVVATLGTASARP